MSVKRTRYLNARKPRAARWSPRDHDLPLGRRGQPSTPRAASRSGAPPPAAVRQRPKTAVAKNRRHRPQNSRGHAGNANGNPLLNRLETEFLFGAGTAPEVAAAAAAVAAAAEDDDDDVSRRAPSLRKTTLGRMLRRSSAASFSPSNGGDVSRRNVRPELSECSSSASSLYLWPLSAGNACSGSFFLEDGRRRMGRGTAQAIDDDTSCTKRTPGAVPRAGKQAAAAQAAATRARRRPSSAAPGNGCSRRRDRPSSSPSQASSPHYGKHHQTGGGGGGGRSRTRRDSPSSRKGGGGGGQNPAARSSSARRRGDRHEAAAAAASQRCGDQGVGASPAAGERAGWEPAAMMNARQALEATIREAVDTVSPVEQFVNARKTIADMKQINTKDSTGDILLSTQGMTKARIAEECWSSEAQRQYRP
ncbi:unnamed protein product [Ectocarpus fasciculatus]